MCRPIYRVEVVLAPLISASNVLDQGGSGGLISYCGQFADGDEGAGGEGWKNVGFAGGRAKQRDVEERGVGGGDGAAIRE